MKPKSGYCINCDNKHGCKTKTPPCIDAMQQAHVTDMYGKEYLLRSGRIELCAGCPFLRSCWKLAEYEREMGCGV